MKLTSLTIEDFRQFKNFRLDFTDPATGKPLEKVCFIGPNGTGKSTILKVLAEQSLGSWNFVPPYPLPKSVGRCAWQENGKRCDFGQYYATVNRMGSHPHPLCSLLLIYCPAESDSDYRPLKRETEFVKHLPNASLDDALTWRGDSDDTKHLVGFGTADRFWTTLIHHLKKREQQYLAYQKLTANRRKTIERLEQEFDKNHPRAIDLLSVVWDRILEHSDLEVDSEAISVPVQLRDNLEAYLRTKSRRQRVHYEDLSTGIRHYLFRLGHIWSLYFNRPLGDSILLVDEPEGSLYPDFLYEIVENYREVAPGCQLFMATHSPIVASQFKPEERFILTFGEDGYVSAHRGISPEGDDPNDMLDKDFGVRNLMPAAGQKKWEEFLELRRRILMAPPEQRLPLVEASAKIGLEYNFPLNGA